MNKVTMNTQARLKRTTWSLTAIVESAALELRELFAEFLASLASCRTAEFFLTFENLCSEINLLTSKTSPLHVFEELGEVGFGEFNFGGFNFVFLFHCEKIDDGVAMKCVHSQSEKASATPVLESL